LALAQDPYQELGVSRGASADEIRKVAKQLHPDQNPDDKKAEERFKRVSAAFDIVGDEEKRKKFDRGEIDADGRETVRGFGGGGFGGQTAGGPGGGFHHTSSFHGAHFEGVDLNDILGDVFGRGGGGGQRGFGGGFANRGADVRAELDVDLEDVIRGAKKRISFSDGRVLDVNIPKGAVDGQVMRLKGQGAAGRAGHGDALIELRVRPHPIFKRDGETLTMDLPVSAPDAILGGKVEAPTPDGPVSLTIPKHSSSGATLRLKGRGLPDGRTGKRGDLLARVMIMLPEGTDPELEAFAEAWRKSRPYTPKRRG
jgi:DnaJ-class molecular chaperone